MHVDGIEAGAMESGRHFNVRVNPLLAQHGHFRARAGRNIRRGNIFIDIKRQLNVKARVAIVRLRLVLLIGAFRVIAQALHLPGGLRPPHTQRGAAFAEQRLTVGGDNKTIACRRLA